MLRFIRCCSIIFALTGFAQVAQAQANYPDRPVKFVIAFPPGGATDTFFRMISNELGTALGQAVVIENKAALAATSPGRRSRLRPPMATRCWWRRTPSASIRRCSRNIRPGSTRFATMTRSARWPARRWCGRSPTTSAEQLQRVRRVVEDRAGHFNYGHAGPGSVSHLVPEVSSTAPACAPIPCRSRAAARPRRRSPAGTWRW